ncbi:MAG: ribose 5-phosphate isomerase B [Lachnoanaerobaculum saburreum]|jgi:ribose-5-phosphate isomerase B
MRIGVGNDHAAVELREIIIKYLKNAGHEVFEYGAKEGEKCDYPIPGRDVAEAIAAGKLDKGVLICGTGIGISLAANKVPGIRAAVCSEPYSAKMASLHNNAQIIAFGARVVGSEMAKMIVDTFLSTEYEGGRHQNRLDIITEIEEKYSR